MLADYGLLHRGEFVVELIRCTEQSCEVSTVTWSAPEPASLVFAAPLVDDAGNEKVAIAWHNAEGAIAWKLAPIAALAQTEPRVLRLPHRVVPRDACYVPEDHILVCDGVALVVFAEEDTLRILRVDVEGTVGSVDVDPARPIESSNRFDHGY